MPYFAAILTFLLIAMCPHDGVAQSLPEPAEWLRVHSSPVSSDGSSVPVYEGFDQLSPLLRPQADTLHVINFWATWCAPCVKELPYFEEAAQRAWDRPVRITLVNLDFRKQLSTRLLPFLRERKLRTQIVVLDDPDANSWINRVDSSWSGAIPATLFLSEHTRVFVEGSLTRSSLNELIESLLKE